MDEKLYFDKDLFADPLSEECGAPGGAASDYDTYLALLLERDRLEKEADQIQILYTKTFGRLITDCFEEKVACIRCKKTLAYYQQAINRGGAVNPAELKLFLDREMSLYEIRLKQMLAHNEKCRKAGESTSYEARRSRELYRRLAKLLHPDVNPHTDRDDRLQELWQRILTAYRGNNVKKLAELEVLTKQALKKLGLTADPSIITDLPEKIAALQDEIRVILTTEPYINSALLEDEQAVQEKTAELEKELADWKAYHAQLEEAIRMMVEKEGITFQWTTN